MGEFAGESGQEEEDEEEEHWEHCCNDFALVPQGHSAPDIPPIISES